METRLKDVKSGTFVTSLKMNPLNPDVAVHPWVVFSSVMMPSPIVMVPTPCPGTRLPGTVTVPVKMLAPNEGNLQSTLMVSPRIGAAWTGAARAPSPSGTQRASARAHRFRRIESIVASRAIPGSTGRSRRGPASRSGLAKLMLGHDLPVEAPPVLPVVGLLHLEPPQRSPRLVRR